MPHLSELHGAATHLAVVAVPVYLLILLVRRTGRGGGSLAATEPWVLGAALAGIGLAGITGLLVWGQSKTTLRDGSGRLGTVHFWLGIVLAVLVVAVAAWRWRRSAADRHTHGLELVTGGVLALAAVLAQGYIGGRMTYHHAVGIDSGGQLAQTARGTAQLEVALAGGRPEVQAGKQAFSEQGLGCASCHGDQAQGQRGPRLAGGVELEEFRGVHAHGLFPPSVVTDRDFAAVNAYLKTLSRGGPDGDAD
jgi:mono/diheme cytochrome c family protein